MAAFSQTDPRAVKFCAAFTALTPAARGKDVADMRLKDVTPEQWKLVMAFIDEVGERTRGIWLYLKRVCYNGDIASLQKRYSKWCEEDTKAMAVEATRMGPLPQLSKELEGKFEEWLLMHADCGVSKTVENLLEALGKMVAVFAEEYPALTSVTFGRSWLDGFFHRHPDIVRKRAEIVNQARIQAATEVNVKRYFDILEVAS